MEPRRRITALFAAVVAAGIVVGGPAPTAGATAPGTPAEVAEVAAATATFPGANGRIAYTKVWYVAGTPGPDLRAAIFTVRPNGSGNKRLTFSRVSSHPKWSPSGGRIAFERAGAVWVMRADGSDKRELVDGELVGWMPTGGRILTVTGLRSEGTDPTWTMYTLATGETEELPIDLPIVDGLEPPYDDYSEWSFASEPTLSPDGELLAVMLERDDDGDGLSYYHGSFFTVRLDGSELTRVPYYTYSFGAPGWSPDGDELVYWVSEPRGYCSDSLRSRLLDGAHGSVEISKPCGEFDPEWSPNGKKIVFTSTTSGRLQISNLNGTRVTTVLPRGEGVYRYEPDWQSVE